LDNKKSKFITKNNNKSNKTKRTNKMNSIKVKMVNQKSGSVGVGRGAAEAKTTKIVKLVQPIQQTNVHRQGKPAPPPAPTTTAATIRKTPATTVAAATVRMGMQRSSFDQRKGGISIRTEPKTTTTSPTKNFIKENKKLTYRKPILKQSNEENRNMKFGGGGGGAEGRKPMVTPFTVKPLQQKQTIVHLSQPKQQLSSYNAGRPSEVRLISPHTLQTLNMNSQNQSARRSERLINENREKLWNRNPIKNSKQQQQLQQQQQMQENQENQFNENYQPNHSNKEMSVQVNELEISNPDIITGDMKIVLPSKDLIQNIEYDRNQKRLMRLLKAERRFEPFAKEESEHLTDLKEFLERSAIKKRPRLRKTIDQLEEDRRMISSLDETFKYSLPKVESITDIKERIRRKEDELISMFDSFNRINFPKLSTSTEKIENKISN